MDNQLPRYEVISEAKAYEMAKERVYNLMCRDDFTPETAKEIFAKEHEKSLEMQRILKIRLASLATTQESLKRLLKTRNWQIAKLQDELKAKLQGS